MQNVFITGANRGLGLGFVRNYLDEGAHVWACYRKDPGRLKEIDSPSLHLLNWDVTHAIDEGALAAAEVPSSIHLLINNAGIYGPQGDGQDFMHVTPEIMAAVFDINCIGPLRVTQQLLPRLSRGHATVANISSKMGSAADNTSGGSYAYRASKSALLNVSRSMAHDLAGHGLLVIALHPGWVRTDMTDGTGLIDIEESVRGMSKVIANAEVYEPGSFAAFDGKHVPF